MGIWGFRMARIVSLILAIYLVLFFGTVLTFLNAYGAFKGNVGDWTCDPQRDGLLETRIILNRWYLDPEREPWLFRAFFVLNVPSAVVAWGLFRVLERFAPPFQHLCPFGLSAGTYTYGLTLFFSPLQWLFAGHLLSLLLRRCGIGPKWTESRARVSSS